MRLTLNVKPTKYEAPTKEDLVSKITSNYVFSMGHDKGIGYTGYRTFGTLSYDKDSIRVINFHKVRKKVERLKRKNPKQATPSKVIKPSHWIGYVYKFDFNLLQAMGVKEIKQNTRNFTISK